MATPAAKSSVGRAYAWIRAGNAADERRRLALREADDVLDEIEELRLRAQTSLPHELRSRIQRLGQPTDPRLHSPMSVADAHDYVLAVQQPLMASNPRNLAVQTFSRRGAGQPIGIQLDASERWVMLTLPRVTADEQLAQWIEDAQAIVERAFDRWAYAQHHLRMSAAQRNCTGKALRRARLAWENYWRLLQEINRIKRA